MAGWIVQPRRPIERGDSGTGSRVPTRSVAVGGGRRPARVRVQFHMHPARHDYQGSTRQRAGAEKLQRGSADRCCVAGIGRMVGMRREQFIRDGTDDDAGHDRQVQVGVGDTRRFVRSDGAVQCRQRFAGGSHLYTTFWTSALWDRVSVQGR